MSRRAPCATVPSVTSSKQNCIESATTADDVVDTLVAALNVGGEAALIERLKRGAALVILDNCEHVVDDEDVAGVGVFAGAVEDADVGECGTGHVSLQRPSRTTVCG